MAQQAIDIDAAARVLLTLTRRMGRAYTAAAESGTMAAGEIVEDMALMPAWAPGKYSVGAVRQKDGQPYRGASDAYKRGEYILWTDGMIYTPTRDGVSHTPDEYPADWEVVS